LEFFFRIITLSERIRPSTPTVGAIDLLVNWARVTFTTNFCVTALEEAIVRFGKPGIFYTDQGSQFMSFAVTNALKDADIRISIGGRGRWMDNVFIERL
jgi:transposase InsO family protein